MPALIPPGIATIPFRLVNPDTGTYVSGTARIDTGADQSIVGTSLLAAIGVSPTGSTQVEGVNGAIQTTQTYVVNVDLGSHGLLQGVTVQGMNLSGVGYGMLLGDNILSQGWLLYDGLTGTFDFQAGSAQRFGLPSTWPLLVSGGLAVVGVTSLIWAVWEEEKRAG